MSYTIKIDPEAIQDIQDAIKWYNAKQATLGKQFFVQLEIQIEILRKSPYFQMRYANVRCLPIPKFPFMIHFTIDDLNKIVVIHAVFNTYLDPKKWVTRNK